MPDNAGPQETILILGGTREAAANWPESWCSKARMPASSPRSPAAPRSPPRLPARSAPAASAASTAWCVISQENQVTRLIDATHPFARQISANAVEAARLPAFRWRSEPASPGSTAGRHLDRGGNLEHARDAIPPGARVLLALGSQHIGLFAARDDVHFVVRMIDPPEDPAGPARSCAGARPTRRHGRHRNHAADRPFDHPHRLPQLRRKAAYAKIEAARDLGLPVIMVSQNG
jgi:precorrin-6A/cobalt-precorrin-6A reductase